MASAKAMKYQELREARGLSPADVAGRLGVDEAIVRGWENDEGEPGDDHLRSLADVYGVSKDKLRHIEDDAHHPEGH